VAAVIGFVPALLFTVFDLIAISLLTREAFRSARG
jgi:hypothetical protein